MLGFASLDFGTLPWWKRLWLCWRVLLGKPVMFFTADSAEMVSAIEEGARHYEPEARN